MPDRKTRCAASRALGLFATAVVCAAVVGPGAAAATPSPPPNPTDSQLGSAQSAKDAYAAQVGRVGGRIALIQARIQKLDGVAQLAEQKLALALQHEQRARAAAVAAQAQVSSARRTVDAAHRKFVIYVQANYTDGNAAGNVGGLLAARDPNALLDQTALQDYETSHQIDASGVLQRATVARSNMDAAARRAFAHQAQTTRQAQTAQNDVLSALTDAKSQKLMLNEQLAAQRHNLQVAQIKLTGLSDQRAAYLAWRKEQARLAALEAERLRQQRLAQQRAAAANQARQQQAAERARQQQAAANSSTSGGTQTSSGPTSYPATSGGGWSAAKGQRAVSRVMGYLGMPYSWAAGNASGPTYGVSEPGSAFNDSNILGFDCSGLTIYAWAPWLSMDHYAATQYTQAGSYHPSIDNLMPGDLLFWSGDGSIGGIGHEAMYVGNGNVIQAPQSGDVIKITNVYNVESGYFGATRPLT